MQGVIFDIQRFSLHDGGGIRTLVFLKGCPLRCPWCCNPESQSDGPELLLFPARCLRCGACHGACAHGALLPSPAGIPGVDRARCQGCGACAAACPALARVTRGQTVALRDVLREVERDRVVFRASGGGVTVSGGEPLRQPDFTQALLEACRARGLDTAIETCGHVPWEACARVFPHADAVLFDVKHLDPVAHRRAVGADNALILANLRRAVEQGANVTLRLPLIPGFNEDAGTVRAVAALAGALRIPELHLLPYHGLGEAKHHALGRPYAPAGLRPPPGERLELLRRVAAESADLIVRIGG